MNATAVKSRSVSNGMFFLIAALIVNEIAGLRPVTA